MSNIYKKIIEEIVPKAVLKENNINFSHKLLIEKPSVLSLKIEQCAVFCNKKSFVLLDFGKEINGGIRIYMRGAKKAVRFHITLGESASEAYSILGQKNSGNDHSMRDFEVVLPSVSDLTFGQTGFRFAKLELLEDEEVLIQAITALNEYPDFENETEIITNDLLLNEIINTAKYTLKLNCLNGYITDGIKRDRRVWSGDLNQELLSAYYMFGDIDNIKNSISYLRYDTYENGWVNSIPSYSAWWIINLCDYCSLSGNMDYFYENEEFAINIVKKFNFCINDSGQPAFEDCYDMEFYLDWPTFGTNDAVIGCLMLISIACQKLLRYNKYECCYEVLNKLKRYKNAQVKFKQTRAMQILSGDKSKFDIHFFEKDNTAGFSTFMSYYILDAYFKLGGKKSLDFIREYYGGMLKAGATTFWEDFDISELDNSCNIYEIPNEKQGDTHGDNGKFCYKGFRRSLCHGWSSGILVFIIENIIGIKTEDGFKSISFNPNIGDLSDVSAKIVTRYGDIKINIHNGESCIDIPKNIILKE